MPQATLVLQQKTVILPGGGGGGSSLQIVYIVSEDIQDFLKQKLQLNASSLKAYSLMLNRGRSQNFQKFEFLHIFVALL